MAKAKEDYDFTVEFAKLFIPPQKPARPLRLMADAAFELTSYPPVGIVTQLKDDTVCFVAALEIDQLQAAKPWQVCLWHSLDGGDWTDTQLEAIAPDQPAVVTLQPGNGATTVLYFRTTLKVEKSMTFTLKYRCGSASAWRWIKDEKNRGDGVAVVNKGMMEYAILWSSSLANLIRNLNSGLDVRQQASQSPKTLLWEVRAPVEAAQGDKSTFADINLGLPWGGFLRWFALVRPWSPWLAPRHGRDAATFTSLDNDAVMCAFLSAEGRHMVVLGVSGIGHVSTVLRSGGSGVKLHIRNDADTAQHGTVLVAVGDDFESANAAAMYHARSLVMNSAKELPLIEAEVKKLGVAEPSNDGSGDVAAKWMEDWVDGLGYCTWNGLGQRLTEHNIFNALKTLKENNISISNLIIDDNWQTIDYKGDGQFQYGWKEFEAEPQGFPRGLRETMLTIRTEHPSIQHIAVWHALLGYWGGISPDGKIAQLYQTTEVMRDEALRRNLPLGGPMRVVAKGDVQRFYDAFYSFLAQCGVDGVKTDAQFMADTFTSVAARRELVDEYLTAWTISTLRHFGPRAISCMSQTPHILFRSLLPRVGRPAVLCRNSDDFWPEIPESHPWHIWSNAHNALFTQHLNVLPDWDMFQTVHDYSAFHAAARCVSGGPIYITDQPGRHDVALVEQMTGRTTRGHTVIFRPSVVGRAVDQYVCYDDDAILKVGAYNGPAVTGTPILGLFNTTANAQTALIPLAPSFRGLVPGRPYVVRSHVTGMVSPPLIVPGPLSTLATDFHLPSGDGPTETTVSTTEVTLTIREAVKVTTTSTLRAATTAPAPTDDGFFRAATTPQLLHVSLPVRGHDVLTAHPASLLRIKTAGAGAVDVDTECAPAAPFVELVVAVLGLLGKLSGAAALLPGTGVAARLPQPMPTFAMEGGAGAVMEGAASATTGGAAGATMQGSAGHVGPDAFAGAAVSGMDVVVTARLKALGTLGVYISILPRLDVPNDFMVMILGQPVPVHVLRIGSVEDGSDGARRVLEIDVEAAWLEMGLSSGWSNEVEVKIFFKVP